MKPNVPVLETRGLFLTAVLDQADVVGWLSDRFAGQPAPRELLIPPTGSSAGWRGL